MCYLQPVSTCSDVPLIIALEFCTNVRNMYTEFQYKLIRPCFHVYIAMPKFFVLLIHRPPHGYIFCLCIPLGFCRACTVDTAWDCQSQGMLFSVGLGFIPGCCSYVCRSTRRFRMSSLFFFVSTNVLTYTHTALCVCKHMCMHTSKLFSYLWSLWLVMPCQHIVAAIMRLHCDFRCLLFLILIACG